jgi:hypothetical protein
MIPLRKGKWGKVKGEKRMGKREGLRVGDKGQKLRMGEKVRVMVGKKGRVNEGKRGMDFPILNSYPFPTPNLPFPHYP